MAGRVEEVGGDIHRQARRVRHRGAPRDHLARDHLLEEESLGLGVALAVLAVLALVDPPGE